MLEAIWVRDALVSSVEAAFSSEMLDSLAARYGEAACQKLLAGRGEGMTMSVTYYPQINEFRGVSSLQIVIQNYIC